MSYLGPVARAQHQSPLCMNRSAQLLPQNARYLEVSLLTVALNVFEQLGPVNESSHRVSAARRMGEGRDCRSERRV